MRSFRVAGRGRPAVSIGGAEHFSLPAAYPRLREVNVYLGWAGGPAQAVQLAGRATSLATRVPGVRAALRFGGEQLAARLPAPAPGTTSGRDLADRRRGPRRRRASRWRRCTCAAATPTRSRRASSPGRRAARRRAGVAGAGAVGPLEAFGLEALERGCAEAGLERVRP